MNKIYFKNLNGLRFLAAFCVVIHHIELLKKLYGFDYYNSSSIVNIGKLGVILFFVLSGFLITYLLLMEKQQPSGISIKNFYIRRILRIWPLYYFILVLSFLFLPVIPLFSMPKYTALLHENFFGNFILFIAFLPNVALTFLPAVPFASQAWSVGVEEQFYLFVPFIIKKTKNHFAILIGIIASYIAIKLALIFGMRAFPDSYFLLKSWAFWDSFNIDCMAIGGIAALILFHKKGKLLSLLFNNCLQAFVYLLTLILIITGFYFPYLEFECYAGLFAFIILNLAGNPKAIVSLEFMPLNYLGKISYGLYMYHGIAIAIVLKTLAPSVSASNWFIYPATFGIAIIMSTVSYQFMERKFIGMKLKYSKIISGDNVKK